MEGDKMKARRYTAEEKLQLRTMFEQGKSDEAIAEAMGRTVIGVQYMRRKMKLFRPDAVEISREKGHQWTEEEELFISNYWKTQTDSWMAKKLGVSVSAYKHKRRRMKVQTLGGEKPAGYIKNWERAKGRRRTWTFKQEEFIREHYPTHSAAEIAQYLGRGENAIQWKAKRMGLKKAYISGRRGYERIENYYNF